MKKVLLALLGLVLLAILSFFCFQNKADSIREALVSSTHSALAENGITGVTADLKGQGLETTDIMQLRGEVPTEALKSEAEKIAQGVEGVGAIENHITIAKVVETVKEVTPKEEKKKEQIVTKIDPYTLTLTKDEAGKVVLEGYVDNEEREKALVEKAQKLFGANSVTNNLKVAAGAPKDWEYISTFALERLHDVDYGSMKLSNNSYEFTGHLQTAKDKATFLDGIRTVMSNPDNKYGRYRGDYIITAPIEDVVKEEKKVTPHYTVSSCQKSIEKILGKDKILFDYNKASINKHSYTLLDTVIEAIQTCKVTKLEIAGHTDNIGRATYNQKLSEKRAIAVENYFVKKGIHKDILEAKGYGESKPIAPNTTKEGRAENRRIEFIVKGVEK